MTLLARLRAVPSWQITLGVALLALGFLIAAQLRSEGPRVRYTSDERANLTGTVLELQEQQATLRQRILELRAAISEAELSGRGSQVLLGQLNDAMEEARIAAGLVALRGTGIIFRLEDSTTPITPDANEADYLVTARDVRTVAEELWLAGAEAISVNEERLVQSSAIVDIGGSVLINSAFVAGPYEIRAIGPDDLLDRVNASQGFQSFVQIRAQQFGIRVAYVERTEVRLPAFAGTVAFRQGRPLPSATPVP
jgi:uncharacterized protein YlxW (UPF0749 family)